MRIAVVLLFAAAAVLLPGSAATAETEGGTLLASVGPGFVITLTHEDGRAVTRLRPGTYTIRVSDKAAHHNFHLVGPGVDRRTEVAEVMDTTWTVTLRAGRYAFRCDPHSSSMRGAFTVGAPTRTTRIRAALSARQARQRVRARRGSGVFAGTIVRSGARSTLRWTLTTRRLSGRAVAAHVHLGRRGRSGPVLVSLCRPCRPRASGTARVSPRALRAILRRAAYVNVHTPRNRGGEIRGQIVVRR